MNYKNEEEETSKWNFKQWYLGVNFDVLACKALNSDEMVSGFPMHSVVLDSFLKEIFIL